MAHVQNTDRVTSIRSALVGKKYFLTPRGQERVRTFAEDVARTNAEEYSRRGQNSRPRIVGQIRRGKIAEVAVYRLWQNAGLGRIIQPPDFDIYGASDKDFSADLRSSGAALHVKSVSAADARRYGASWVFQRNDPLVLQPTLEDVLVLCETHGTRGAEVAFVLSGTEARAHYAQMRVKHLRITKVCIYAEDLA